MVSSGITRSSPHPSDFMNTIARPPQGRGHLQKNFKWSIEGGRIGERDSEERHRLGRVAKSAHK